LYITNFALLEHEKEIVSHALLLLVNHYPCPSQIDENNFTTCASQQPGLNWGTAVTGLHSGIQDSGASGQEEWLLSSPERTMVQLVAEGLPDRAIAQRLDMNENQVREQLLVIFRKLAVAGLLDQLLYVGDTTI
jgi:DNA-binding CsgD family transcriptional regulator